MDNNAKLDTAGVFTATGPAGTAHLFYDGADFVGRWIVACQETGSAPTPMSRHGDLDEALVALARSAGVDQRKFSVDLPCGQMFTRPGRVDASSVLAAMGYVVTRGITSYVIVEASADATPDEVAEVLTERLNGRAMGIGKIDAMDRDAKRSVWCCDLVLPFEGPLRRLDAKDYIDKEFEGTDLSVTTCYEILPSVPVVANAASVIAFRPASQAA